MTDREKVFKGFEVHTQCGMLGCSGCPYLDRMGKFDCVEKLYADVLAMRDGVRPAQPAEEDYNLWVCGVCGNRVGHEIIDSSGMREIRDNFCSQCGTKVKWDA